MFASIVYSANAVCGQPAAFLCHRKAFLTLSRLPEGTGNSCVAALALTDKNDAVIPLCFPSTSTLISISIGSDAAISGRVVA